MFGVCVRLCALQVSLAWGANGYLFIHSVFFEHFMACQMISLKWLTSKSFELLQLGKMVSHDTRNSMAETLLSDKGRGIHFSLGFHFLSAQTAESAPRPASCCGEREAEPWALVDQNPELWDCRAGLRYHKWVWREAVLCQWSVFVMCLWCVPKDSPSV